MQPSDTARSRDGTTAEHNGHMICCRMSGRPDGAGVCSGRDARQLKPSLGAERIEGLLSREGKSDGEGDLRDRIATDSPPLPLKIGTGCVCVWVVGGREGWELWQRQWSSLAPAIHVS